MKLNSWIVTRHLTLVTVLTLAACSSNDEDTNSATGPLMRPGDNCLRCHKDNSPVGAPKWNAAGTVFPSKDAERTEGIEHAIVYLSDESGTVLESLETNAVGNFFTATELPNPFFVELEFEGQRIKMPCAPPAGSCNACHDRPPVGDAPGRIFTPQSQDPNLGSFDCVAWDSGRGRGRHPAMP